MNPQGLRVVVTGGASGIGEAFARRLVELGAHVWVIDRDGAAVDRARAAWPDGRGPQYVVGNVGDVSDVESIVSQVEAAAGGIDVLVNNAAILRDQALVSKVGRRLKKHSLEDWHETIQSNLTGVFLMAREAAHSMLRAGTRGLIVNVSSVSRAGNAGQTAYSAAKAGIDAMTVTWARELAPYGIRVAAIAPGFVETGMTQRIPSLFLDRLKEATPIGRYGRLDEFAHAIEFVVTNDYFNGRVLELDGGLRF
jgi:3-oxoacyl-[acyl-carrier protein] reductase